MNLLLYPKRAPSFFRCQVKLRLRSCARRGYVRQHDKIEDRSTETARATSRRVSSCPDDVGAGVGLQGGGREDGRVVVGLGHLQSMVHREKVSWQRRRKMRTFEQARLEILSLLGSCGWALSDPKLKIPHATSPDRKLRFWFKPQAVHYIRRRAARRTSPATRIRSRPATTSEVCPRMLSLRRRRGGSRTCRSAA